LHIALAREQHVAKQCAVVIHCVCFWQAEGKSRSGALKQQEQASWQQQQQPDASAVFAGSLLSAAWQGYELLPSLLVLLLEAC
jgi:hypothetical protein